MLAGISLLRKKTPIPGSRCLSTVQLNYTVNQPTAPNAHRPMVILHGLFGSKQNWRAISKQLSRTLSRSIYTVDLRNHGDSPHQHPHTYESMSADLIRFIGDHHLDKPILMGHSMGGKVVMRTALDRPDLVSRLVVDDMAPAQIKLAHNFASYVDVLADIEQQGIKSQKVADQMLGRVEGDVGVRQFLLTNMKKDREAGGVYRSRIPLKILGGSLDQMMGWDTQGQYDGPTLFIGGSKSPYINPKIHPVINRMFPNSHIEMLDTGHWVHAERPLEFMSLVERFCLNKF